MKCGGSLRERAVLPDCLKLRENRPNIFRRSEICGNQNYKGPNAFHKHFSEWRHSNGMRCLGIPSPFC
ncbi:hypothetical protein L596_019165 [Steinernema carpocapsae]|uniref:Splicing factor SF3a60 /Prp9 subunit C-terminal domain-containing protein n=1 Tax=Steinernema carpocapsae TaxID=34508 RepID=A0A4U5N7R4_STECR|nr:hypothetical protein L596_019165 [Steinernema carpocapsae]